MPPDESHKFRFSAARYAADVSVEKAGEEERTVEWGRARKRLTHGARKNKQRGIADSVRRQACPRPCFPSRRLALRTMMPCGDVAETAGVEAVQHRARFVERVPSNVRIEFANRVETRERIHLGRPASVIFRLANLNPLTAVGFPQSRAGDPELGVALEFLEQKINEAGIETNVGVEPQNVVVLLAGFVRQELGDHALAAGSARTVSRQMMRFDPGIFAGGLVEYRRRCIGGTVVDNNPTIRLPTLRRHRGDELRQQFFLVASRCDCDIPNHARYL